MTDFPHSEIESLLRVAHGKLTTSRADEPLSAAVTRLVECAIEAVGILREPDSRSAVEMIGYARAAVTAATYALREVDGRDRRVRWHRKLESV
ncbi:hypothetical protein [Nocardia sp. CNY236]|uniref:hypothetical protein n=1 Tax=Nocardia sp. CNY236 TaxID=1169152 RepID=UPI000405506B|nr:hypothetical protein [Nocardia sp. CNY236]